MERYEEAKEKMELMERICINSRNKSAIKRFDNIMRYKSMEMNILFEDLEKGWQYIQELISEKNNDVLRGNLLLYSGIYYFKKNQKDKALEYLKEALSIAKTPFQLQKIQHYIQLATTD